MHYNNQGAARSFTSFMTGQALHGARYAVFGLAFGLVAYFATQTHVQASEAAQSKFTVEVGGIKSDQGQLIVRLFDSAAGYPSSPAKAVLTRMVPIQNGRAALVLPELAHGTYAAAVAHDENRNNELDRNLIGLPAEGIGFSNNPTLTFGPPSFQTASVPHTGANTTIRISMVYWN